MIIVTLSLIFAFPSFKLNRGKSNYIGEEKLIRNYKYIFYQLLAVNKRKKYGTNIYNYGYVTVRH